MKKILSWMMVGATAALLTSCTQPQTEGILCACPKCGHNCEVLGDTIPVKKAKPSIADAIRLLKAGNQRYLTNHPRQVHMNKAYIDFIKKANQGDFAYATIISCADSRVPVERIFDACFMELFVIRVAGNVFQSAELGSAEYGLFHVNTPVLVVLGHTECGAVSAVVDECTGHHHDVERNVLKMIEPIKDPAKKVIKANPNADTATLKRLTVEENVRAGIRELLKESDDVRRAVEKGDRAVVGAVYDMDTDEVKFMDLSVTEEILKSIANDKDND